MRKVFVLVLLLLPFWAVNMHTASAQGYSSPAAREGVDNVTVDGVEYKVYSDGSVAVNKMMEESKGGRLVVPDRVLCRGRMCAVVGICNYAFFRTNFTSVAIPEGVTFIGQGAFMQCERLTQVNLPSSLNWIDGKAFAFNNKLKVISCKNTLPPDLKSDSFLEVKCEKVNLKVPKEATEQYKETSGWNVFRIKGIK